jgi:hypothetical protein
MHILVFPAMDWDKAYNEFKAAGASTEQVQGM